MSLTIILSGPKVSLSQARNALAAERFDVQATEHDHGLPQFATEGEATSEPQAFITVLGEDVDKAHAAVRPLGWRLRMHHDEPVSILRVSRSSWERRWRGCVPNLTH